MTTKPSDQDNHTDSDNAHDTFDAIADPQRRHILEMLAQSGLTVTEITARLGILQPAASKHLKILRDAGIVQAQVNGRERLYTLNASALRPVFDWVRPFEEMVNERLDNLDSYLQQLQSDSKKKKN